MNRKMPFYPPLSILFSSVILCFPFFACQTPKPVKKNEIEDLENRMQEVQNLEQPEPVNGEEARERGISVQPDSPRIAIDRISWETTLLERVSPGQYRLMIPAGNDSYQPTVVRYPSEWIERQGEGEEEEFLMDIIVIDLIGNRILARGVRDTENRITPVLHTKRIPVEQVEHLDRYRIIVPRSSDENGPLQLLMGRTGRASGDESTRHIAGQKRTVSFDETGRPESDTVTIGPIAIEMAGTRKPTGAGSRNGQGETSNDQPYLILTVPVEWAPLIRVNGDRPTRLTLTEEGQMQLHFPNVALVPVEDGGKSEIQVTLIEFTRYQIGPIPTSRP